MPYTAKQQSLIRAVAHGWKPSNKDVHMTQSAAKKMMGEMGDMPMRPPVHKKSKARRRLGGKVEGE